jgi:DNA-binding MarR family transcriptional regulator
MIDANAEQDLLPSIELFYFAYRAFTSHPDRLLDQRGLGRVHHRILHFVGRRDGITVSQLQDTLSVSKQALNTPLRQLIEMKLIAATAAAHDRRVKQLGLTRSGQQLEQKLTATQTRLMQAAFTAADPQAAQGWQQVMRHIAGMP